jgi:hypothetical protein
LALLSATGKEVKRRKKADKNIFSEKITISAKKHLNGIQFASAKIVAKIPQITELSTSFGTLGEFILVLTILTKMLWPLKKAKL